MAEEALEKRYPFVFRRAEISELSLSLVVGSCLRSFDEVFRSEVSDPAHEIDVVPNASTTAVLTREPND